MATIELLRESLRTAWRQADEAHPGLLLHRGLPNTTLDEHASGATVVKTEHVRRFCRIGASSLYNHAYDRWKRLTADTSRFQQCDMQLVSRLLMGLNGGALLETGCTVSHVHGMPFIPGSSIKGVARAHARESVFGTDHPDILDNLFGSAASADPDATSGLSGLVVFHDAWWIPASASTPFVEDVVTTHHSDYYAQEGRTPASDVDSPIPNAQIAVRGRFLFVVEGPLAWADLAAKILVSALCERGIGARTRSGYGLFTHAPAPTCRWVDDQIARLQQATRGQADEQLRSTRLADAWQQLDDPALKAEALDDIRRRLQEKGWWDDPAGRSLKKAIAIYRSE